MPITWDSQEPQTATTSPGQLSRTLGDMLPPTPERPPPQDRPFEQFINAIPRPPWETTAKYGAPIAGGIIGSALGPQGAGLGALAGQAVTSGLGSFGGELAGQALSGSPMDIPHAAISGGLSAAAVPVTRALTGGFRAARSVLSSGGDQAIATAVGSGEQVPMSNIRGAINDILDTMSRGGVGAGREPTSGFEKLRQFATKYEATTGTSMPMDQVATMRDELGQLMVELRQGSPAFHKAQALYGALMSDLRQGVATGMAPSAVGYLSAMTDKRIAHAMVPESMLERMMLYGLGGAAAFGHPGALAPAAGLLGLRALQATPPSMLETITPGLATLANPYRR